VNVQPTPFSFAAALREESLGHASTGYLILPAVGRVVRGFYAGHGWGAGLKASMKDAGTASLVPEDMRGRVRLAACGTDGLLAGPPAVLPDGAPLGCEVLSTGKKYVEVVTRFVRRVFLEEY
jgi:hypothetical protein